MKRGALLAVLVGLASAGTARAQTAPRIEVETDDPVAGVGETIHVQASAESPDAMPSNPQIGATPGFAVRGQNSSPAQMHTFANGSLTHSYTLTVDWILEAQRVGTFQIGPPSFELGNTRYSGKTVTLRVVPAGSAPPRRAPPRAQSPFNFSPFDPWRSLFPNFPAPEPQPALPPVAIDPKLSLETPRDTTVFLHATVDKTSAVVGEQVLLTVYEYRDVMALPMETEENHDPQVADFVKHPLLADDQDQPLAGFASIGGRTWQVMTLKRWALFPLRAGDLDITSLTATIASVRQRGAGAMERSSEALRVHVSEPPLAGRPPGFAAGEVGRFALHADVNPRILPQGGAVDVRVELSGTGNIPGSLSPPAMDGVDWLTPEVHENLGPQGREHNVYGGTRTFDFVVRMNRSGDVDLGQLTLPFFDPDQRKYDVARAPLGVVRVTPSSDSPRAEASASEQLAGLPGPRDRLEDRPQVRKHLDDSPLFWLAAVAGWPLALGGLVAGNVARKRFVQMWQSRRASPAAELRERIALARTVCNGPDARQVDAATVRVLEAATVANAGINVRGALGDEVVRRLEGAGVAHDAATGLAELLRECEAARFAPEAADLAAARDRWGRAQRTLRLLERRG